MSCLREYPYDYATIECVTKVHDIYNGFEIMTSHTAHMSPLVKLNGMISWNHAREDKVGVCTRFLALAFKEESQ